MPAERRPVLQADIRDRVKELRRIPARELIPNEKNWRKHPPRQRTAMMAVLQEIGYADALLAREDDTGKLVLIDGHLRSEVTPDTIVPVLILDVDEKEADKILLTLDPLAAMAACDADAFRELAVSIDALVPDFRDLIASLSPESAGREGEDNVPDVPETPVSQRGDLWLLGSHRLLCGDSTNSTDVTRLLSGVVPAVMITDPPYGVNYEPEWRHREGLNNSKRTGKVSNDDRVDWSEAYALFPGAISYVWHAGRFASEVAISIEKCGFEIRSQIIWAKSRFAISRGHYHWQHEPAWYAVKKGASGNWRGDRGQTTLWSIEALPGDDAKNSHGTQKPVECMRRPILNHTNPGQCVYDPFLGSGTTIIAAESTDRTGLGLEIDPAYCDVIVKRWQEFTGKTAKLEDGRTFYEVASEREEQREGGQ